MEILHRDGHPQLVDSEHAYLDPGLNAERVNKFFLGAALNQTLARWAIEPLVLCKSQVGVVEVAFHDF